jgi:hypothetical protein
MKMLESRLILNVTVLASEPDDHFPDGEPMEHGMVAPASLTLLPRRAQVERFLGVSLREDDFIGVPHGNEWGGNVLNGLGHVALPLCQPAYDALGHHQQHSPDMLGGQGHEATERRSLTDKKPMTDLPE